MARIVTVQGEIKHFPRRYHMSLRLAECSLVNLCSHSEELRRALSERCVNLLVSVIDSWALVYKTETSPGGISLFRPAPKDPKSIQQSIPAAHSPMATTWACDEQDLQSSGVTLHSLSTFWGWKMTGQQKGSVSRERSVSDSSSDISPSLGQWVEARPDF